MAVYLAAFLGNPSLPPLPFKVGCSDDPTGRVRAIASSFKVDGRMPHGLDLKPIAVVEGGKREEHEIHLALQDRVWGEWFAPTQRACYALEKAGFVSPPPRGAWPSPVAICTMLESAARAVTANRDNSIDVLSVKTMWRMARTDSIPEDGNAERVGLVSRAGVLRSAIVVHEGELTLAEVLHAQHLRAVTSARRRETEAEQAAELRGQLGEYGLETSWVEGPSWDIAVEGHAVVRTRPQHFTLVELRRLLQTLRESSGG